MIGYRSAGIIVGALEGLIPTEAEEDFLRRCSPAGLTLFRRNIPNNFLMLREQIGRVQSLSLGSVGPFLIAIDQEGGRVSRIGQPFPDFGPMLKLSDQFGGDTTYFENYGFSVGAVLKEAGINCNFAPVVDILTNEKNTAIGDRVFGRDVQSVVHGAKSFLSGMGAVGVFGCLKHFPGQGDANFDTHKGTAVIQSSAEVMGQRELQPFEQLMDQAEMIMVSHCIYPALDSLPATLSFPIVTGLLRKKYGYQGLIVSDDMNMEAIPQDRESWLEAVSQAILAGIDLILVCRGLEKCLTLVDYLEQQRKKSPALERRVEEALGRVAHLRKRLGAL